MSVWKLEFRYLLQKWFCLKYEKCKAATAVIGNFLNDSGAKTVCQIFFDFLA